MRLIPVLDLRAGQIVQAVAGHRADYAPVRSVLTQSSDPVELARAMLDACSATELYVADLDAILGTGTNAVLIAKILTHTGVTIYCDAGLRNAADLARQPPGTIPIWGSETVARPTELVPHPPAAFSVDLQAGRLLGDWSAWHSLGVSHERAVGELAVAGQHQTGAELLILLDLAHVGVSRGPAALELCPGVRGALPPGVTLALGGGVRDEADLARLADAGAGAALVATALHVGKLRVNRSRT